MARAGLAPLVVLALAARGVAAQRPDSTGRSVSIPATLSGDSAILAALAHRLPNRERPDTVRAYPIRRLANGVYAVVGDTGRGSEGRSNAGFVVGRTGVLLIDALASPAQGEALLRTIRTVTPLAVQWVVLTHHHPDHHFGAIVFKRLGATIIAHPDRHTLASEEGDDRMVSDWTGVLGLREMHGFAFADTPDIPVTHDTTLELGSRSIRLLPAGAAHTPGDLMVWLPADRVLFAGNVLIEDGVTMVVDGSSGALLDALAIIDSLAARTVVPGHGRIPSDPQALVTRTRCYALGVRAAMRSAVENGTRLSRALAALPPADRDRPVSRPSRERRNAERVYLEMERTAAAPDAATASRTAAERVQLTACPTRSAGDADAHGAP